MCAGIWKDRARGSFGRLGPAAVRLLHAARQRALERELGLRTYAGAALYQRWLGHVSCSLQRSLHEAATAMWGQRGPLQAATPASEPLLPILVAAGGCADLA